MFILALDIGSTIGLCVGAHGMTLSAVRPLGSGLDQWLDSNVRRMGIGSVVFQSGPSDRDAKCVAKLIAWCKKNGLPYEGRSRSSSEKWATGRAKPTNDEMVDGIESLGFRPLNRNEASAIALLHMELSLDKAA